MQQFKVGNNWIEQQLKNDGNKTELVIQLNGHIFMFLREYKYLKISRVCRKLVEKGLIKPEDIQLQEFRDDAHKFGELQKANDYDTDQNSVEKSEISDYTDYDSDEVHDTRSYVIGYYRGPPKP